MFMINILFYILLASGLPIIKTQYTSAANELLSIIKYYIENASNYNAPDDASVYFTNLNTTTEEYGTFDYIIIGAGAGGTVIANRLSEIRKWNVLLIEAGDYGNQFTDITASYTILKNTSYNWAYSTVPQKLACLGSNDNSCSVPKGRGVGGTSIINGAIYSRGTSLDFNKWAEYVQDDTWSYKNVLPYFKKSEKYVHRDPLAVVDYSSHSRDGYYYVENVLPRNMYMDSFLKANDELGWPIADINDGIGLGASSLTLNTRNGRRVDDGTGFIKPVLHRKNLEVLTSSYVTKVSIDAETKIAQGVNFVRNGKSYFARAKNEVILCAGTIASPQLLMLSGVGPSDHLESLDIPVIRNLDVGNFLRDHIGFIEFTGSTNYTLLNNTLEEMVDNYLQGYGALTTALGSSSIAFYPSKFNNASDNADIEIVMGASDSNTFFFLIHYLNTNSVGTLRLKSKSPAAYPLIDPGYLTDTEDEDLKVLYEGVKIALDIIETNAFKKIDAKLELGQVPACASFEYLSDDYWYCLIKQGQIGGTHIVGTCPMGPDPTTGAVVDSSGKVYGIEKLRVCDANIFPFTMSGHPHAQVLMAAEKISDMIKTTSDI